MRCLAMIFSIPIFATALAAPSTSYRSDYSTFREEAAGLSVFANGFPTSLGGNEGYVAVPVAVALMRNGGSVTFTTESFTLIDAQGNRVPAAGYYEVKNDHPRWLIDQSLMRAWPINVGMQIAERPRIASNFYSYAGGGTRIPRVELGPFSWFYDVIYFPRPPAGLDGLMTLSVAVTGADPIDVKFFMNAEQLARR
jgi:hypothetical protein